MEDNTNLNNTQSPNNNNPMGNNTNSYVPLQNNGQMGSGSLNNPNSSQQGSQPYNPYQQNVGYQQNPYSQYNNYYSQTPQSNQYQQTQIPQWNNWGQPGVQQNQFQQNPGMNINPYQQQLPQMYTQQNLEGKKYCKHCGAIIDKDCVICPSCGKQIEELRNSQPNIVINNSNHNQNTNTYIGPGKLCNKWVSFFLCLFLGFLGAHKFYEGKVGRGILYLFTVGLFGIGWFIDTIAILFKPNPYVAY